LALAFGHGFRLRRAGFALPVAVAQALPAGFALERIPGFFVPPGVVEPALESASGVVKLPQGFNKTVEGGEGVVGLILFAQVEVLIGVLPAPVVVMDGVPADLEIEGVAVEQAVMLVVKDAVTASAEPSPGTPLRPSKCGTSIQRLSKRLDSWAESFISPRL
jgi:hypothetical protein